MKEKTFEELALDESFRMNFGNEEVPMVKVYDVVKLLQQVREATIAECANIVHYSEGIYDSLNELQGKNVSYLDFKYLPTDRIKTDK